MAGSFYIYDKGNWCNLDINKGRLNNGRTVRFAFVLNGKLHLVSREKILRGLRNLSDGLPSSIKKGSSLPSRRSHRPKEKSKAPAIAPCVQSVGTDIPNFTQSQPSEGKKNEIITTIEHHKEPTKKQKPTINNNTVESSESETSSDHSVSTCKELYIDSEDIEIMKTFLSSDNMLFDALDMKRFDSDEDYRNGYLFLLNPLVTIEKQAKIDQLALQCDNLSINEFVNMLGLTHIDNIQEKPKYKTRKNFSKKENKENIVKRVSSDSSDFEIKVMKPQTKKVVKLKGFQPKTRPPVKREYSLLEDHSIVAWLSSGKRSSKVNGNRIWRELQDNHLRLTGMNRSWHSLRNRYLRYILPSLPAMRLDGELQTKLRADAAKGEIKLSRKRRNSIYKSKPVESAWSKRPKILDETDSTTDKQKDVSNGVAHKQMDKRKSVQEVQKRDAKVNGSPPRNDLINDILTKIKKKNADTSLIEENEYVEVSQPRRSRSSLKREENHQNKKRKLYNPRAI